MFKRRGILPNLRWSQGVILLFSVLLREHELVGILFLAVSEAASYFLTSCADSKGMLFT